MRLLLHPAFLVALATLVVNDHLLKDAFPGVVTGKLSDFAGLFAWAWYWSALGLRFRKTRPGRTAFLVAVHVVTALGFAWWKSPASQGFIAWWSAWAYPVSRVVDYGDLWALAVLPLSAWGLGRAVVVRPCTLPQNRSHRHLTPLRYAALLVGAGAFAATSDDDLGDGSVWAWREDIVLDSTYLIRQPRRALLTNQFELSDDGVDVLGDTCLAFDLPLFPPPGYVELVVEADLSLVEVDSATTLLGIRGVDGLRGIPTDGPDLDFEEWEAVQEELEAIPPDSVLTLIENGTILAWRLGQVVEPRPVVWRCE